MQKIKSKLILAGLLIFIILLCGAFCLSQYIPRNESTETGNTAGNLNNNGLFCEKDGIVYFSNAYDHNVLYSMNPDETDLKRLNNVGVASINADSNRIYYSQTGNADGAGLGYIRNAAGMYHCSLNGKQTFCYTKDPVGILALTGNHLYFQHHDTDLGTFLSKTEINTKTEKTVLPAMLSPASVIDNTIYYAGNDTDYFLYALNTTIDTPILIWEHKVWNPVYQDGYIYFMDIASNYELHRYNLSTGEEQTLSTDRLDFFNVYGSIIYYQKSSQTSPALKRINTDGSNEEIVKDGVFESVNITSQYAYFHEFDTPTPVYHQSTFGPINPTVWAPDISE